MRLNSLLTLCAIVLTLSGCGGGGGESTSTDSIYVTITDDYQVESLGSESTINATVSMEGTVKSLYLVLSNNANIPGSSTITHNAKVATVAQAKSILSTSITEKPVILRDPQYVHDFSSQVGRLLSKAESNQPQAKTLAIVERMEDNVGDTKTFYLDADGTQMTDATAIIVVPNIKTALGDKTLNIWVSDDSYGLGCDKSRCVTEDMVRDLANTFLLDGPDNDIYDWVTNVYGEEWETDTNGYSDLISANDEITILLTDIDKDNSPDGGVIGYFWSKDNFVRSSLVNGSNERIMFYADSVMFANGEDTWDIDDPWPKEMVSTLAHEFQHMINFYQKRILLDTDTDTWINEMLSESTEDIIATKIRHIGPRAVDYLDGSAGSAGNIEGRYPLFNANNTLSLTAWNGQLADYSKVNSFGAYLLRNYGGAELLHDIMHNSFEDEQAVVDAVNKSPDGAGKTFANLLSEWGVAVMLSDHESLVDVPFYNTGDFTLSTYNNSTYELGSINFFNYIPLPTIYTTSGTVEAKGNYYYKIGDNVTGDISITLELNGQTEATLIAK